MPELSQLVLLLAVGGLAAIVIGLPLLRPSAGMDEPHSDHEALELRYRVALEALRDVAADRRAGSLDDAGYAEQRAQAEHRAAAALAELEAAIGDRPQPSQRQDPEVPPAQPAHRSRRLAGLVGVALAGLLVVGFFVPPPVGLANPVVDTRQVAIDAALARLKEDPRDTQALSDLADVLAGGNTYAEMQRAAAALIALISLEPDNLGAYNRLITVYIRVADWKDATDTVAALAKVAPDSADVPFFRGLIALQGSNDVATAREEFAKFEKLAPNDPRLTMVRALLAAESGSRSVTPSNSPSP
jgi:tetratricopeptide (TPR) repeat protein